MAIYISYLLWLDASLQSYLLTALQDKLELDFTQSNAISVMTPSVLERQRSLISISPPSYCYAFLKESCLPKEGGGGENSQTAENTGRSAILEIEVHSVS